MALSSPSGTEGLDKLIRGLHHTRYKGVSMETTKVRTYWDDGYMESETTYRDGLRDGMSRRWYSTGHMSREINYKAGLQDGICKGWGLNGDLIVQRTYSEGVLQEQE